MERLTITDIAKLANVSIATVSNYMNGNYQKMSAKTRNKLSKIITENNYYRNKAAHDLASNERSTIGISVADITNPFTSSVLSGITNICTKYHLSSIVTNAENDEKNEKENLIRLKEAGATGFIIDPINPNSETLRSFSNANTVLIDRQEERMTFDTVVTDNRKSVAKMVLEMIKAGYQQIYFVSWPLDKVSTRLSRYNGFLDATGYEYGSHLITIPIHTNNSNDLKNKLLDLVKSNRNIRSAFFAVNVPVLIELLVTFRELNLTYPRDFGIATYEEFKWMRTLSPMISCIKQDSYSIGTKAAEVLYKKIYKPHKAQPPQLRTIATKQYIHKSF